MLEIWKDIDGWENFYQVSSFGRVRSIDRVVIGKDGKAQKTPGKILKSQLNSYTGYISVHLRKPELEKRVLVHRLVAQAFIPNPENKREVNHKSGQKTDNRVVNLEWVTRRENVCHALNKLAIDPAKGRRKPVQCIETGETFSSIMEAAKSKRADSSRIGKICAGKTGSKGEKCLTSGGYHWQLRK